MLDRHLAEEGLMGLLPVRVYSCDVKFRKPSREIFNIALEQAGLTAAETLYIGDSIAADIRGANAAGLISVLKDPDDAHKNASTGAAHRIHQLADLTGIIEAAGDVCGHTTG